MLTLRSEEGNVGGKGFYVCRVEREEADADGSASELQRGGG